MPTGLAKLEQPAVKVTVRPTLAEANVWIDSGAALVDYALYNIAGKRAGTSGLSGSSAMLTLRELAAGAYVLTITTVKGVATQRIVKQ